MASLVTLNAAPYNPYNTSFANIAMEGLRMAQAEMARRDQNAQNQFGNYMRSVQFGADVLFKNQEMAMNRKKFDFSVDQALFERKLATEEQAFKREQFKEGIRQFDVSSGFREEELGLRRDAFAFDKERWTDPTAVAGREAQVEGQVLQNTVGSYNLQEAVRTAPLRELGQRVQMGTQIANAQTNLINAETGAVQAENRAKYYDTINKERAAQARAINGRIDDTRNAIARAHSELAKAAGERRGSDRVNNRKTAMETQIESNIQRLQDELRLLNSQLSNIQGDNQTGGGYTPPNREEEFLRGPRTMERQNPLLPNISPTPELD